MDLIQHRQILRSLLYFINYEINKNWGTSYKFLKSNQNIEKKTKKYFELIPLLDILILE
jgi:hypothetical protein